MTVALLCLLAVQAEPAEAALFRKCGSAIPWIGDGLEIVDGTPKPPIDPSIDRPALLDKARAAARERNRLVLWYCPRVPGTHTYRAALLDTYMRAAVFSDPGVVDLVRAKFVPLRMAADEKTSAATGIRFPEVIEPALIFVSPDGRVVHTIDRIRTFNADWIRAAMVAVLMKNPAFNAPLGDSVEDLLRGGDDEKALEKASPDQKALIFRRAGRFRDVLELPCAPLHKGIALLALKDFEKARAILEKEASPEGIYHRAALEWWSGRDPERLLRTLAAKHPDSPWGWRAASSLVTGRDAALEGPLTHAFEDVFLRPPEGLPTSTRVPAESVEGAAARAVGFLLRAQREDGSWRDTRYCYGWASYMIRRRTAEGLLPAGYSSWPDTGLRPNVVMAVTAQAALALREWRDLSPQRIDEATARAEAWLRDDGRIVPGQCEQCYAESYRLLYFAHTRDAAAMNRIVKRLAELQDADGFWGHEYPGAFATAAVVRCLTLAKTSGADVPDAVFRRAGDALLKTRGEGGRQAYRHEPGKGPGSEKNSMGRTASSELALLECGRGSLDDVAAGVDVYWKHLARLEAIRTCDNHSDEELAGFFYFNSVFHTVEAARALGDPLRAEHLRKFRAQILAIPEWDGSFIDSHELGKSYGTAMALLILNRVK